MIQTLTYALTTLSELQTTVSERIFNLTESGQIQQDVALVIMQYEYPSKLLFLTQTCIVDLDIYWQM